jgi:hypothetical protein
MSALREFVRDQLEKAQAQLEKLLLLHSQERREELDIRFWIHRVTDDPSENQKGWSFLRHPQNLQGALPDRQTCFYRNALFYTAQIGHQIGGGKETGVGKKETTIR